MPLFLVDAYLHCDVCGLLPGSARHSIVYARADGGWQLPEHWRFVDETQIACSDTCAARQAEAHDLAQRQPGEYVLMRGGAPLYCAGCDADRAWRISEKFYVLPPRWLSLSTVLIWLLCPDCTANEALVQKHTKNIAERLASDNLDPF